MFQGQILGLGVVLSGNFEDSLAYIKHLEEKNRLNEKSRY